MRSRATISSYACLLLCAVFLAVAATADAVPLAKGGVIHACVLTKGKKASRGFVRIVAKAKACKKSKGERPISWSAAATSGVNGANGTAGPKGASGPAGANGAGGAPGAQGEKGSAATLEKTLEETLAQQTKQVTELTAKVTSLTQELLGLETGLGKLEGLSKTVEGLTSELTPLKALPTTVANLGTNVTELTGKVGTTEGLVGTLQTTVGKTCEGLKTVTGQTNVLSGGLKSLTESLSVGSLLTLLGLAKLPTPPGTISTFECK
jgi:hypothetical protein